MAIYVAVGARYIQAWLAQTPRLRLIRGASKALSGRTSNGAIDAWISETKIPAARCAEAGEIAGVVVLEISDATHLESVSDALTSHLLEQLPGLQWAGWARSAESYLEATNAQTDWERSGDSPPLATIQTAQPVGELGMLASCPGCHAEPSLANGAVDKRVEETGDADGTPYGRGCTMRYEVDETRRGAEKFDPKTGVVVWGQADIRVPGEAAHDFEELATKGGYFEGDAEVAFGRKESRSHLALVIADGNGVGSLFEALAKGGPEFGRMRREAVNTLTKCIFDAVTKAALHVTPPDPSEQGRAPDRRVIEGHYVGGDDILVSLPARYAWMFTVALMMQFEHTMRSEFEKLLPEDADLTPAGNNVKDVLRGLSLGVGVVFAHRTYPFAARRHLAEQAMSAAKREGKGKKSCVAFRDLTVDASGPPSVRSLDELQAVVAHQAMPVEGSARAQLSDLLQPSDVRSATEVLSRLRKHQKRIKGLDLNIPETRTDREAEEIVAELKAELLLARWWPAEPRLFEPKDLGASS